MAVNALQPRTEPLNYWTARAVAKSAILHSPCFVTPVQCPSLLTRMMPVFVETLNRKRPARPLVWRMLRSRFVSLSAMWGNSIVAPTGIRASVASVALHLQRRSFSASCSADPCFIFRLPLRIAYREEQYFTSFAAAWSLALHVFTGMQPCEVLHTQNNTSHHQHPRFLPRHAPTPGAQPSVMDTR